MKKMVLILLVGLTFKAFSQNTVKIRQIDSLVSQINNSGFKTEHDTIINDVPSVGMSMKTIITAVTDNGYLKKYVNNISGSQKEQDGTTKQNSGSNAFYFDQNKLIKVEEYFIQDNEKIEAQWYYSDDKPLYYTVHNDRSEARANLLLSMAKTMLSKFKN